MKTNHRRGFKASTHRDQAMWGEGTRSTYADKSFCASISNDFNKGNRGMAKNKRGAKKFLRTRTRFHEKAKLKEEVKHL